MSRLTVGGLVDRRLGLFAIGVLALPAARHLGPGQPSAAALLRGFGRHLRNPNLLVL